MTRDGLKVLEDGPWKSRIAAKKRPGISRWHGDIAARRAVYNNRVRLLSGVAKAAFKLRTELCERSFAHVLDRGGMRRTWLRGRENVHKRYLLHVAGHNLGLIMRAIIGHGTPREAVAALRAGILAIVLSKSAIVLAAILVVDKDDAVAVVVAAFILPE